MSSRLLTVAFFTLTVLLAKADDVPSVTVGETTLRLPLPPGLVDVPKDSPVGGMFAAIVPPGTVTLQRAIIPDGLKNPDTVTSETVCFSVAITPQASMTEDMDSARFQKVVEAMETKFSAGRTLPRDDTAKYAAIKKKLEEMGASGISSDPTVCLGELAKGDDFVTFLMRNHAQVQPSNGGDFKVPLQSLLTLSYVRVKQKLLIIFIIRTNDTLGDKELDSLKDTTGKYIAGIISANKAPSP